MTITHKWIAGAVVLALALLAGTWFLLVSPKRTEAADLQAQAESQQATNQSLETELALLKQQKKDLPEQQAALAGLRTQVPQTQALPSLVRLLDQAAEKSGVDFTTLSPTAAVPVMSAPGAVESADGVLPPEQLAAVNSDIVVNGGYFEIVKFVNALENLERYVLVTNMTIVESDSSGEEAGASENAGDLTATLSSRVFLLPTAPETVEPAAAPATETQ
jgi:Tfp pilus assembly protein PilO